MQIQCDVSLNAVTGFLPFSWPLLITLLRVDVIARGMAWLVNPPTLLLLFKACNKALFGAERGTLLFAALFSTLAPVDTVDFTPSALLNKLTPVLFTFNALLETLPLVVFTPKALLDTLPLVVFTLNALLNTLPLVVFTLNALLDKLPLVAFTLSALLNTPPLVVLTPNALPDTPPLVVFTLSELLFMCRDGETPI